MFKKYLRRIWKRAIRNYLWFKYRKVSIHVNTKFDFKDVTSIFPVKKCMYNIEYEQFPLSNYKDKCVGAQIINDNIIAIPNDETQILIRQDEWIKKGKLNEGMFKWTGGCVWNNSVYAFPRTANSFLKIDETVQELFLQTDYDREHHYSGVCTRDGVVYQPPRNTNHILKTSLVTGVVEKIEIVPKWMRLELRYCGSIFHPNGLIYIFPEQDDRVIKLDPKSDKWTFIGQPVSTMVFDAKVGLDGNIYGYSAYGHGIMKINVLSDEVSMIHTENYYGAYGTKYGLDGCLYSVPGDGSKIWKYDVIKDTIEAIIDLKSLQKAKYAGGVVDKKGVITFIPASAESVIRLVPDVEATINDKIYELICLDNY